jgi:hypothetical protein
MSTSSWPLPPRRGPIRSASAPRSAACWAGELAPAWRSAAAPACTPAAYAAWAGLRSASTSPRRCCSAPATACPRPAPTPYDFRSATAACRPSFTAMAHTDMPAYPAVLTEAAPGPAAGRALHTRRRPPGLLRRVRRPERPRRCGDPPRLTGRPLDQGVLDDRRRRGQGRRHSPSPAQPHARLPERRPDPRTARRRRAHPRHARHPAHAGAHEPRAGHPRRCTFTATHTPEDRGPSPKRRIIMRTGRSR